MEPSRDRWEISFRVERQRSHDPLLLPREQGPPPTNRFRRAILWLGAAAGSGGVGWLLTRFLG
jgi:hypothetical protein